MDQLSFPSVRVVEEYMNNFLLRAGDAYEKFAAKAKNTAWKDLIVDNKEAFGFLALSLIIGTVFSCRRKPLTIKNGDYNG